MAVSAVLLLNPSHALADPAPLPPLPPAPGYPPGGLIVPGKLGPPTGFQSYLFPNAGVVPSTVDARGVGIGTNADHNQPVIGMPGARLGPAPPRVGPLGPTAGVRTANASAGVDAAGIGGSTGLEDPYGRPATDQPGPEAVLTPIPLYPDGGPR